MKNSLQRVLDLVLSNMDHRKVTVIEDIDPLLRLDNHHPALLVTVCKKPLKHLNENRQPKFNFFRADYDELNRLINSIDWTSELEHLGVNEATNRFYDLIKSMLTNVPKVKFPKANYPCWYYNALIMLIIKKSIAKQSYDNKSKKGKATADDYFT